MATAATIATTRGCHIRFTPNGRSFDIVRNSDHVLIATTPTLAEALKLIKGNGDVRRDHA